MGADRGVGPLTKGTSAGGSGSVLDLVLLPFPAQCGVLEIGLCVCHGPSFPEQVKQVWPLKQNWW